jgi:3-oxoacyl-[acyl-carrier protein] reductase
MPAEKMNPSLAGRFALVTGGGIGIGRAIAEALAEAGAFVGVHCNRSLKGAQECIAKIRRRSSDGVVLQADLTDPDQADKLVPRFIAEAGKLDILVNNAGCPVGRTKIEDCSLDIWDGAIMTNLTSAFLVSRAAIPHLRASRNGAIINILSLSIQTGGSGGAGPYAIAKGGLEVMTRTLARELAPRVRVNAVMPGVIETRHHQVFSTPERLQQYRAQTPIGRNGQPEEVASAVVFLASDASSFTTGAILDVNGGRFFR